MQWTVRTESLQLQSSGQNPPASIIRRLPISSMHSMPLTDICVSLLELQATGIIFLCLLAEVSIKLRRAHEGGKDLRDILAIYVYCVGFQFLHLNLKVQLA